QYAVFIDGDLGVPVVIGPPDRDIGTQAETFLLAQVDTRHLAQHPVDVGIGEVFQLLEVKIGGRSADFGCALDGSGDDYRIQCRAATRRFGRILGKGGPRNRNDRGAAGQQSRAIWNGGNGHRYPQISKTVIYSDTFSRAPILLPICSSKCKSSLETMFLSR